MDQESDKPSVDVRGKRLARLQQSGAAKKPAPEATATTANDNPFANLTAKASTPSSPTKAAPAQPIYVWAHEFLTSILGVKYMAADDVPSLSVMRLTGNAGYNLASDSVVLPDLGVEYAEMEDLDARRLVDSAMVARLNTDDSSVVRSLAYTMKCYGAADAKLKVLSPKSQLVDVANAAKEMALQYSKTILTMPEIFPENIASPDPVLGLAQDLTRANVPDGFVHALVAQFVEQNELQELQEVVISMIRHLRSEMLKVSRVEAAVPLVTALSTLVSAGPSVKGQPTAVARIVIAHPEFHNPDWKQGKQFEELSLLGPFFRAGVIYDLTKMQRGPALLQQLFGAQTIPAFDHTDSFKVEKGQANVSQINESKQNLASSLRLYRDYLHHVAKTLLQGHELRDRVLGMFIAICNVNVRRSQTAFQLQNVPGGVQESSDNFVNNISFILAKLSHKIFAADRVEKAIVNIDPSYILAQDTPFVASLKESRLVFSDSEFEEWQKAQSFSPLDDRTKFGGLSARHCQRAQCQSTTACRGPRAAVRWLSQALLCLRSGSPLARVSARLDLLQRVCGCLDPLHCRSQQAILAFGGGAFGRLQSLA
eukprot:TRINITY_DN12504_c0_g1_i19.p1 TRINITY_DN12504_c0_g1~~TRINITY_DN12504_c0_g1_i19.p1  ORF type:complete len:596 (+),score=139.43 TRINITY_DN12504_c0_g1_i19:44-1831(+)